MQQPNLSMSRLFSLASAIEAVTWAGLLVGMFLKYGTQTTEMGVWLFGRLHGIGFLLYLAVALLAAWRLRWPWWATGLALLAAIPPLATIPVHFILQRKGVLAVKSE